MFIWDFVADTVLGQIIDWLYGQIVGFLGDFFMQMGSMGAELFEMSWVQSVVLLFYYLAWALYVTGIVVAAFECGIEYQNGINSSQILFVRNRILLFIGGRALRTSPYILIINKKRVYCKDGRWIIY